MIFLLCFHGLSLACAAALIWILKDQKAAISFAGGAGLIFFSLLVSVIFWPLIFRKKLIALSVSVIVFKFAILVWFLNEVATGKTIQLDWFAGGLGLVVVSSLATAVREAFRPDDPGEVP